MGLGTLGAERQAVDPLAAEHLQKRFRYRTGIALTGAFGIGKKGKMPMNAGKHFVHFFYREQRGRTTADKKSGKGGAGVFFSLLPYFLLHFFRIGGHVVLLPGKGCKIAIGAFAFAEGNVQIKSRFHQGSVTE